jgi:hypothetical protein
MEFVKDIVAIVSMIAGIYVAISGLSTWKKQLKGSSEYAVAKQVLKIVYTLRNSISELRNPFISAEEIYSAISETGIDVDKTKPTPGAEGEIAAFWVRWKKVYNNYIDLDENAIEAEVLWGNDAKNAFDKMKRKVFELNNDLDFYLYHLRLKDPSSEELEMRQKLAQKIMSFKDNLNDKYWVEFQTTIQEIENISRPIIEK